MQNVFIESSNVRMRDELLNATLFFDLPHSQEVIKFWATDCNLQRLH